MVYIQNKQINSTKLLVSGTMSQKPLWAVVVLAQLVWSLNCQLGNEENYETQKFYYCLYGACQICGIAFHCSCALNVEDMAMIIRCPSCSVSWHNINMNTILYDWSIVGCNLTLASSLTCFVLRWLILLPFEIMQRRWQLKVPVVLDVKTKINVCQLSLEVRGLEMTAQIQSHTRHFEV